MGMMLLPAFLAMFVGFSYLGLRTGIRAIVGAQGRLTASLCLLAMAVPLIAAEIVLPFAFAASTRVSAGGFILAVVFAVAGIAGSAGTYFKERYRLTGMPIHGLSAAALFLAAAGFPLAWLWLAERMQAWFQVGWDY